MGLYDEVSVTKGNKVKLPPPLTHYQTNSFNDSAMRYLDIDKDGKIKFVTDPERDITNFSFDMYGPDETDYHRRYVLTIFRNQIIRVIEVDDDKQKIIIYEAPMAQLSRHILNNTQKGTK